LALIRSRVLVTMATILLVSGSNGCGKTGPERYELAGKVTFRGQPVPKGYILFAPDKGNSGPGAKAGIINGSYEMMPGQGMVGGPHRVTIVGTDGIPFDQGDGVMNPMGKPLFPEYEVSVDLPKQSGTYDFEVSEGKK
jgi:hypothetical protein